MEAVIGKSQGFARRLEGKPPYLGAQKNGGRIFSVKIHSMSLLKSQEYFLFYFRMGLKKARIRCSLLK